MDHDDYAAVADVSNFCALDRALSRRNFLAVGTLALGGSLLAACTSSSSGAKSHDALAGDLTYWYAPLDSSQATKDAWVKYNVTAFEKKFPKIHINGVAKSSGTIDQNIQVALAAHRGPDLVVTPGPSNAIPYASAGYLADLGPYYESTSGRTSCSRGPRRLVRSAAPG